jgi:hypothetical protein
MNARRRLPHRRGAVALDIEHAGHRYRMHVGYFPDGAVGEVFLDATKQNSMLDAFAADAAILVSLLLQHGARPPRSATRYAALLMVRRRVWSARSSTGSPRWGGPNHEFGAGN